MLSLLPSILVLGLAALFALRLTTSRSSRTDNETARRAASQALAVATAVQALHFTEETITGFPEKLGLLVGLPPMSSAFFISFNLVWIAIWIASVWGLRRASAWAFFAAWFLSIAGLSNAIAHPFLSLASGAYFPGLITSPLIGLAALWLWTKLRQATDL